MVNWRREGQGQSVMKRVQCNGLPEIHAWLTGVPSARSIQCNGLAWIYGHWRREGQGHVYHVVVLVHLPLCIHNYR